VIRVGGGLGLCARDTLRSLCTRRRAGRSSRVAPPRRRRAANVEPRHRAVVLRAGQLDSVWASPRRRPGSSRQRSSRPAWGCTLAGSTATWSSSARSLRVRCAPVAGRQEALVAQKISTRTSPPRHCRRLAQLPITASRCGRGEDHRGARRVLWMSTQPHHQPAAAWPRPAPGCVHDHLAGAHRRAPAGASPGEVVQREQAPARTSRHVEAGAAPREQSRTGRRPRVTRRCGWPGW